MPVDVAWPTARWRFALRAVLCTALLGARVASAGAPAVPAIAGPIAGPGAPSLSSTTFDLAPFAFVEQEFFLSGSAVRYASETPLAADGRWSVARAGEAAYTTRVLVRRPAYRARFNGTVVVEWLNVSGGFDAGNEWTMAHTLLLREGFAWVGVSAQSVGIHGGPPLHRDLHLKALNPVRYEPLAHPGDSFSYDLFSQAGRAVRERADVLLGGLRPRRVIAAGESQSAFRLVTYVDGIHPLARVYDGFLVHSRSGDVAPLSEAPEPAIEAPPVVAVRDDVGVPVLVFQTETDVVAIGSLAARQPDSVHVRTWEVAGTAHADTYLLVAGPGDEGPAALDTTHLPPVTTIFGGTVTCDLPINAGPQHQVLAAAIRTLARWVAHGRAPRSAPLLAVQPGTPPTLERDALGNAQGGIRTPPVDAPIAVVTGTGQTVGGPCSRLGTTIVLDAAALAGLYADHGAYVRAVRRAARRAVRAGFLLPLDARAIRRAAAESEVGASP
jgi:hypothetical protein